ncbi:MAG TPA: hypothetical protein VFN35_21140 [Ktedonobacteraceae bacterium]|nr:hypothetical protein [Ktedonobacteraceae bacterium]
MPIEPYEPEYLHTVKSLSLTPEAIKRVDAILVEASDRVEEVMQGYAPLTRPRPPLYGPEEMRLSSFGQYVMIIAAYVDRWNWEIQAAEAQLAIQRVYRLLYGHMFDDGYMVPKYFYRTLLGELIDEAHWKIHGSRAWVSMSKASRAVGVARQSIYDRIEEGKLLANHWPRRAQRVLKADLETWIAEREQERREQERKKKKAAQAEKDG